MCSAQNTDGEPTCMKPIEDLLATLRDETITQEELKELERLLAEKDARERLFDEFLTTATIAEALRIQLPSSPGDEAKPATQRGPWTPYLLITVAVLLIVAAVYKFERAPLVNLNPQDSTALTVTEEKKIEQIAEKPPTPPLPPALQGFSGTVAGTVIRVDKGFVIVKMSMIQPEYRDKEVLIVTKNITDAPILRVNDVIYATAKHVGDHLVASTITKAKRKTENKSSDF
jgi:hypothetical protein